MSSDREKVENLIKSLNSIRNMLSKFDDQKLENISDIKLGFYSLCDNNRDLIFNSNDKSLQLLKDNIFTEISYYEDKLFKLHGKLVDYQIALLNEGHQQNLEINVETYNGFYRMSDLDKVKERYHIKYDTEDSIVNYIISAYK